MPARLRASNTEGAMPKLVMAVGCLTLVTSLAGCGDTVGERAATGGIAGAVVAGPVGAVVGGTVGAVTK
jgi:osmotically inducible lipoprotein OsmB